MSTLDPRNITVMYVPPATAFRPVYGRTYTVIQQPERNQVFVNIGQCSNAYLVNKERENVIRATWVLKMGQLVLMVNMPRGNTGDDVSLENNYSRELKQELANTLVAMITADKMFYSHFPWLLDSPIYVQCEPLTKSINSLYFAGTPRNYALPRKEEGDFSFIY